MTKTFSCFFGGKEIDIKHFIWFNLDTISNIEKDLKDTVFVEILV